MNTDNDKLEWLLLIIIGLMLATVAYVYLRVQQDLRRQYSIPLGDITLPQGSVALAEGERQTVIRGCFWCHGDALEGKMYFANANNGIVFISPNLTDIVHEYTPAEFARAIRHGVSSDGTSLQVAMPAYAFYNISDADIALIIAYIKSRPRTPGYTGEFRLLPVGWFRWAAHKFSPPVAELIDHQAPRPDPGMNDDPVTRGRYLVKSVCETCHSDSGRLHFPGTPDLAISAAYTRQDFHRLLRTGIGVGDRELNYEMQDSAKNRFVRFTDDEVDAMYTYLRTKAGLPAEVQ